MSDELHARISSGPYSIASDTWPGIGKLAEECGEVVQVVAKIIGMNGAENWTHWDGTDVRMRLQEELADVIAAIRFVRAHNPLDGAAIDARADEKFLLFQSWHCKAGR